MLSYKKSWLLTFIFAIAGFLNICFHEIWRDEAQAWLIARFSHSLPELFHNLRYDGHPSLWYLLLYCISYFWHDPFSMQVAHLIISVTAVFIFLRHAPFRPLFKALFIFGYFILYEYTTISRNYGIEMLLLFAFCACFRSGAQKNYFLLFTLLFLLAKTNFYGTAISFFLAVMLVAELWRNANLAASFDRFKLRFSLGLLLYAAGLAATLWGYVTPPDGGVVEGWRPVHDATAVSFPVASFWKSFFPVPSPRLQFWNTGLLDTGDWGIYLQAVLAVAAAYACLKILARKTYVFFLFAAGSVFILLFLCFKFQGYMRHYGQFYLLFIACLWLSGQFPDEEHIKLRPMPERAKQAFISAILIVQCAAGIYASVMDWVFPFSGSRETAAFLQKNDLQSRFMMADLDFFESGSAYLDRGMHYLQSSRKGTFLVFDTARVHWLKQEEVWARAHRLVMQREMESLLITDYPLEKKFGAEMLFASGRSIAPDEQFFVYRIPYGEEKRPVNATKP